LPNAVRCAPHASRERRRGSGRVLNAGAMSGPECGTLRALFALLHCRERARSGCLGELDLHDMFDPDGSFSNYNIAENARGELPAFSTSTTASAVGASSIPHASEGHGSTSTRRTSLPTSTTPKPLPGGSARRETSADASVVSPLLRVARESDSVLIRLYMWAIGVRARDQKSCKIV
jgi:hypothetical protein